MLFNHAYTSLHKPCESFTLKHPVLKQSQVDELMYSFVAVGISLQDIVLLLVLFLDVFSTLLEVILFLLSYIFRLLLLLLLTQNGLTCIESSQKKK